MTPTSPSSITSLVIVAILLALLAGAVFVGHRGWVLAGNVSMSAWGWIMMTMAIVITLGLGAGLMALIFYSSRAGFDNPPEHQQVTGSKMPRLSSLRSEVRSSTEPHDK